MRNLPVVLPLLLSAIGAGAQEKVVIVEENRSVAPATLEYTFTPPPFAVEHQVRLGLEARIEADQLLGSNPWIRVAVNGNWIAPAALLNKPFEFKMKRGTDLTWARGDRWRVLYSPDFEMARTDTDHPNSLPDTDPYRFVWDITPHVRAGENTLVIQHLKVLEDPSTLVLRDVWVEVGRAIEPPGTAPVLPAPEGPVPTYIAQPAQPLDLGVTLAESGRLAVTAGGRTFDIATRTSLPAGQWHETAPGQAAAVTLGQPATARWATDRYRVERTVTVRDDHVHVADKVTNTTDDLVGVMVYHETTPAAAPERIVVGGGDAVSGVAHAHNSYYPGLVATWPDYGLGLLAEDDVFRVHVHSYAADGALGLGDDSLGLAPGASVTLEWSIWPRPGGDYWDVVNTVRRAWGANYEIPGPFSFLSGLQMGQSAEYYGQWVRERDLEIVCGGIASYPDGIYAHGTGILFAPEWVATEGDWVRKMMAAAPEVKALCYFHSQISTEPDNETKYADSKLIDGSGRHLGYPYRYRLPLYLATRENSYGKALWGFVNTILDDIGAAGLYWDEMSHSVIPYAQDTEWDGVTVVIDRRTHDVVRKQTAVALITQPLKLDIVRHVRERGKFLMANTQPATRTMLRERIVRFVETGTYHALTNTHFGCPLGLGNHHVEADMADRATNVRRILEYGAVHYNHHFFHEPPEWNFTAHMFPITPTELHEGVVLGDERIHTARSGIFGWPDGAAAEVHVVDADGRRVENPQVVDVGEGGRHAYEIRMPSDHFALLERR